MEYNNVVEQLFRSAADLDAKLPMLFLFLKNEAWIRKVAIIVSPLCLYLFLILTFCQDCHCSAAASISVFFQPSLHSQLGQSPSYVGRSSKGSRRVQQYDADGGKSEHECSRPRANAVSTIAPTNIDSATSSIDTSTTY